MRLLAVAARHANVRITKPRSASWLSPPPLGRTALLVGLAAAAVVLSLHDVHVGSTSSTEDYGFRAGWIAAAQMPLLFALAARANPVGWLVGRSHLQLNWLHRGVSRLFFLVSTLHAIFFLVGWLRAGIFWLELELMPTVVAGLLAWLVLAWTALSSLAPLRARFYEFFVAQHLVCSAVFLWLVARHFPHGHGVLPLVSAAVFALDVAVRAGGLASRALRLPLPRRPSCDACRAAARPAFGHAADVRALDDDVTVLTVRGVHFGWQPGQHLLVWTPRFWWQTPHPFTISSAAHGGGGRGGACRSLELTLRTRGGLTRKLNRLARAGVDDESGRHVGTARLRVLVSLPFGPGRACWNEYAVVVLISSSTGASFSLPILESILLQDGGDDRSRNQSRVARISVLLVGRRTAHLGPHRDRVQRALAAAAANHVALDIVIATTAHDSRADAEIEDEGTADASAVMVPPVEEDCVALLGDGEGDDRDGAEMDDGDDAPELVGSCRPSSELSGGSDLDDKDWAADPLEAFESVPIGSRELSGRPDLAAFIDDAVGDGPGPALVSVCGGPEMVAGVRNAVARTSARRSLYQQDEYCEGIALHVEEFSM